MKGTSSLVTRVFKRAIFLYTPSCRRTSPSSLSLFLSSFSSVSSTRSFSSLRLSSTNEEATDTLAPDITSELQEQQHEKDHDKNRKAVLAKLSTMKVAQLKEILKRYGQKPRSDMRKGDLIEACVLLLLKKYEAHQQTVVLKNQRVPVRVRSKDSEAAVDMMPIANEEDNGEVQRRARTRALRPVEYDFDDDEENDTNSNNSNYHDSDRNNTGIMDHSRLNSDGNGSSSGNRFSFPHGDRRDERLENVGGADVDITFLGTASCIPSITRGVSCVALRLNSDVWMFDCGESSQVQLQKSRVKASRIRKIFITHAHGDHSFGLPGVLCLMGQSTQSERDIADPGDDILEPIDIYGPEGTRDLIRAVVQLSYSRVVAPHRIHELKNVPNLHKSKASPIPTVRTRFDPNYGEREGSRDIYPDEKGCYQLFNEGDYTVTAAPMQHTIPCVGYVVNENNKPGRLKVESLSPVVERNRDLLKKQLNLRDANKAYAILKNVKPGESFTFPDGTVFHSEDIVEPPRDGRKIVILGDTCNSDMIADLAQNADVLIHESTNAWIKEFDLPRIPHPMALEKDTYNHGHSTPQMAGRFCKKINAKRLVLTHFSPRYRGGEDLNSMKVMWRLEEFARSTAGLTGRNDVIAAWDHMILPVSQDKSTSAAVNSSSSDNHSNSMLESDK